MLENKMRSSPITYPTCWCFGLLLCFKNTMRFIFSIPADQEIFTEGDTEISEKVGAMIELHPGGLGSTKNAALVPDYAGSIAQLLSVSFPFLESASEDTLWQWKTMKTNCYSRLRLFLIRLWTWSQHMLTWSQHIVSFRPYGKCDVVVASYSLFGMVLSMKASASSCSSCFVYVSM